MSFLDLVAQKTKLYKIALRIRCKDKKNHRYGALGAKHWGNLSTNFCNLKMHF